MNKLWSACTMRVRFSVSNMGKRLSWANHHFGNTDVLGLRDGIDHGPRNGIGRGKKRRFAQGIECGGSQYIATFKMSWNTKRAEQLVDEFRWMGAAKIGRNSTRHTIDRANVIIFQFHRQTPANRIHGGFGRAIHTKSLATTSIGRNGHDMSCTFGCDHPLYPGLAASLHAQHLAIEQFERIPLLWFTNL